MKPKIRVVVAAVMLSLLGAACGRGPSQNVNVSKVNENANVSQTPEEKKMVELDHDDLRYEGDDGQEVTVTVEATGTNHLVSYILPPAGRKQLAHGEVIRFNLKKQPNDAPMPLQLNFEFTGQGNYKTVIRSVSNEPNNECVQTVDGPPRASRLLRFFVK